MSPTELIFTGGTVVTLDERHPRAEALAVRDGRIRAVGAAEEILALREPDTEIVDLAGRCLLPGFVEAHGHPTQDQLLHSPTVIDIRPVTRVNAAAVHTAMNEALVDTPADQPLVFVGLEVLLQKGFREPTRAWLDELGPQRPIVVWHNSGHAAWMNEAALRYAGLDDAAADPPGGHFERDSHGRITKALEAPAILAVAEPILFAAITGPELLARDQQYLAARGVTTTSDMAFSEQSRALVRDLYQQGLGRTRMRTYERSTPDGGTRYTPGEGDDLFRQIGVKIWVDGSPWIGNIATSFPYLNTPETKAMGLASCHRGGANYTADQLREIVDASFPHGWQLSCHVHGDVAVDTILDVYQNALREHPRDDHRLRLEHCGAMRPEQFRRAADLGVTCSLFVDHLYYWGDVLVDGLFGPDYGAHWIRTASAMASGMPVSFHNDAPVTPVEPLRNMQVAVTRSSRTGRVLAPEECVTVHQALRAQTIDAAHQLFADDIIGSLEPGKYADLVVLDRDPHAVDPSELADLAVHDTYLAGAPVFGR